MKHNKFHRIALVLFVICFVFASFVPFVKVSAAEGSMIIEAGTYRFNDVLTKPLGDIEASLHFTVVGSMSSYGISTVCSCSSIVLQTFDAAYDYRMFYNVVAMEPDVSLTIGASLPTTIATFTKYNNGEYGWGGYDVPQIQTITIPYDQEASAEFGTWFYANVKEQKQISGKWRWNDVLSLPSAALEQDIKFSTSPIMSIVENTIVVSDGSVSWNTMIVEGTDYAQLVYNVDDTYSAVYNGYDGYDWNYLAAYIASVGIINTEVLNGYGQTIDYGTTTQWVSADYYDYVIANAKPVTDQVIGSVTLYDYPGITQIGVVDDLVFPVQVAVVRNGLQFTNNGSDVVNFVWEFTGTGKFQGVNINPLSPSVDVEIGRIFTLNEPADLYITIVGDKPNYPVGSLTFFDYTGKTEIGFLDDLDMPSTVKVVSNGIEVYFPYSTVPDAFYPFTGTGEFVGVNLWPNSAYLHYPVGSEFTLQGNIYLYFVISSNIVDDELGQLIGDLNNGPPGAQDKVDQFDKDMQDKLDGILGGSNKLEGLTPARPNLDGNLNLDPDAILSAGPLIATIWTIDGLISNFVMLIVILAVGYVFFGKKE